MKPSVACMYAVPATRNKEDTNMENEIKKDFLQEHFRKHDSITLYQPDGTPVTFGKYHNLVVTGGHRRYLVKDYESLMVFYKKQHLCLKPVITIG